MPRDEPRGGETGDRSPHSSVAISAFQHVNVSAFAPQVSAFQRFSMSAFAPQVSAFQHVSVSAFAPIRSRSLRLE
jgi:hypothetical protein